MSLRGLQAVLQPPGRPRETGDREAWDQVERLLGTRLPPDYEAFIDAYGSGSIDDFLFVLNPFAANANINLLEAGRLRREAYAELRALFPQTFVHDVFPAAGGLLPFAISDNANVFYWKTMGDPATWTVVAYEGRGPAFFEFEGTATEFLAGLLARTIVTDVLPADFPSDAVAFVPYDP